MTNNELLYMANAIRHELQLDNNQSAALARAISRTTGKKVHYTYNTTRCTDAYCVVTKTNRVIYYTTD